MQNVQIKSTHFFKHPVFIHYYCKPVNLLLLEDIIKQDNNLIVTKVFNIILKLLILIFIYYKRCKFN